MKRSRAIPTVFNLFKPAGITSYDVIRSLKRNLPNSYKKLGHFGTLDPFASGVLLVGTNGATKINDFVHKHLPKTYLAVGKLGIQTKTGDITESIEKQDESDFFKNEIRHFELSFLESTLRERFLGSYMQSPHAYSAAKFEGKALHIWAREGVEIKKKEVQREIYDIEVVKYAFPYLAIRFTVSSGTYIRSLFSDCANYLGTFGTLLGLLRESIGHLNYQNSISKTIWQKTLSPELASSCGMKMDHVLPFNGVKISGIVEKHYINGIPVRKASQFEKIRRSHNLSKNEFYWIYGHQLNILGLAKADGLDLISIFNLPS